MYQTSLEVTTQYSCLQEMVSVDVIISPYLDRYIPPLIQPMDEHIAFQIL